MKKYLLSFGVLAAAALSMTSCLSNSSSDQKYTFGYGNTDCFNRVYDMDTQEYSITLNPTYSFVYNMSKGTLDVDMSNIKLGDSGYSGMSFKLSGMGFSLGEDYFWKTSAKDVIPYGASSSFVFNSFNLNALPTRTIANMGIPVYYMTYTVNNRYRVMVYPTQLVYFGSIAASDLNNNTDFSITDDKESYYAVQINPEKMTAQLLVSGAQYKQGMNRYNFRVKDLPIELTTNGYVIRTKVDEKYDVWSDKSTTEPVKGQSVSNVLITASLDYGATISFTIDLGEDVDGGLFGVNASLRYLFYNKQENQQ